MLQRHTFHELSSPSPPLPSDLSDLLRYVRFAVAVPTQVTYVISKIVLSVQGGGVPSLCRKGGSAQEQMVGTGVLSVLPGQKGELIVAGMPAAESNNTGTAPSHDVQLVRLRPLEDFWRKLLTLESKGRAGLHFKSLTGEENLVDLQKK